MVYGYSLENCRRCKLTVSSNLTLSASTDKIRVSAVISVSDSDSADSTDLSVISELGEVA